MAMTMQGEVVLPAERAAVWAATLVLLPEGAHAATFKIDFWDVTTIFDACDAARNQIRR